VSLTDKETSLLTKLYDECIRDVDEQVGVLLKGLDKLGILDDTYIIVTSDHGQQFFEHGEFGHDLYVYDEVVKVPLIIVGPDIPRVRHDHITTLLDLPSTMLDLLGIQKPHYFQSIGQNLLKTQRKYIFIEESRRTRNDVKMSEGKIFLDTRWLTIACRTNRWKYIYRTNGKDELYDLLNDPRELQNVVETYNEVVRQLKYLTIQHLRKKEEHHRTMYKISRLRDKLSSSQNA